MTTPLLDIGNAQITRSGDGTVTVDDPGSPLVVRVRLDATTRPARVTELTVTVRHPSGQISAAGLARLPIAQIRRTVASAVHPNDAIWHTQARPRPAGSRSWDADHWNSVIDVHDWAVATGRTGGGPQAIADMWDVARNPTAYRWIKRAIAVTGRVPAGHTRPPR